MVNARIAGIASYVPEDILDNEMLSKMVDTSDEWITTRVGIKERRILKKEGAGSSFLGINAVTKLLESTSTDPQEVDLLICATSNPDYRFPSTGSIIADGCGMKKETQDKLFKEMITTKGKNGTGLGLYMSYSNIKAHFNGDVTVETEKGLQAVNVSATIETTI